MKMAKYLKIFCVLVLGVILSFWITTAECAPKVYNLTIGTMGPMEGSGNIVYSKWAKWLARESGGRIKLTILPNQQAAKAADLYDAARQGIVDMASQYSQFLAGRMPLNDVASVPLIFGWPGALQAGLTHMDLYSKYPELQNEFKGVKLLQIYYGGPTQIQTAKRPIHRMEDLKGLVQAEIGPYAIKSMKALGGTPEALPPFEIYDAIAKGVVGGISVNWDALQVFGYSELINYSTQVSLTQPGYFIDVMNLNTWKSLPPELQKLFVGSNARNMAELLGYEMDAGDIRGRVALREKFKKASLPDIYILPEEEKAKWVEICMPLREEWVKQASDKIGENKARAILGDTIQFAKKYEYIGIPMKAKKTLEEWGAIKP